MSEKTPAPAPASRESAARGTHEEVFRLLRAHCAQGRVLDLPCGSGAFTRRLLEAGYEAVAGDLEQHPGLPGVPFQTANMNLPLPFPDAYFDAVVSIEGIEHIERPFDFVRECRRILKPGGVLLLSTPNISSLRSRWRWLLTGFHNKCKYPLDETNPQPRHHISMLSYPELRYMLHTRGFRIEQVAANRVKGASWIYLPWAPVAALSARLALRRGARSEAHARVIAETRVEMHTRAVLFGETLIIAARAV